MVIRSCAVYGCPGSIREGLGHTGEGTWFCPDHRPVVVPPFNTSANHHRDDGPVKMNHVELATLVEGRVSHAEQMRAQRARPSDRQEGGDHYKKLAIQPAEYVHRNKVPYLEGSVIYYVTRWRDKGGLADIDKAIHTLQLLKEMEEKDRP